METGRSLEERLLRDPLPHDAQRGWRASYTLTGAILTSLFIAYHLTAVLVHSAPDTSAAALQAFLNRHAHTGDYLRSAGIARSWAVFAPDPPRQNAFVRVLVEGLDGQEWDLGHEALGRRRYPYLFYDRMAKINRQMVRRKDYRLSYAGWVCRDWERTHGGEPARAVRLVAMRTRVPSPAQAYLTMGYAARGLDVDETVPEVYPCASTPHAQLPANLRARYGLSPLASEFQDVPRGTWWGRDGRSGGTRDAEPAPEPIE